MPNDVRPLLLVADRNVSVQVDKTAEDAPAYVQQFGSKGFKIVICEKVLTKMYQETWMNGKVSLPEFECGVLLHEVSHIKYDTFSVRPPVHNGLFHFIDNVIEDSRIEYNLTYDHPSYAKYIRWILVGLKRGVDLSNANGDQKLLDKVDKLLSTLYNLTRFGVIDKGADMEFVSFALPLVLSCTRGNRRNAVNAAKAIYDYVMDVAKSDPQVQQFLQAVQDMVNSMTQEEIDAIKSMGQIASSNSLNIVKQDQNGTNKIAGSGDDIVQIEEKENSFFRSTVEKQSQTIAAMRQVFKRFFEAARWVKDYDGDLSIIRQQNAYMNSMTGDVGLDYVRMQRNHPSLDVVVLRDISSSTSAIKDSYAAASICFLASLEELNGVRTAMIDFGDTAKTIKHFSEELRSARLFPRAQGGTNLVAGLEEMRPYKWTAKKRLGFVITDGYIPSFEYCTQMMGEMGESAQIEFKLFNIDPSAPEEPNLDERIVRCRLESLPAVLSRQIVRQLR